MSAVHYYRDGTGSLIVQDRITTEGWEVKEAAEEGATPMVTLTIPDPDMTLDYIGHRRWIVRESSSEATDDVIFSGFVSDQTIGRSGGDLFEPLGRVWTVSLSDMNTLWGRRILRGTDCKRPAETDVARIQWLLATSEMGYFDDITTLVSTADPVNMDAVDYRGQYTQQVADDCAQASGKNWYITCKFVSGSTQIWAAYGDATYDSDLFLSNSGGDLVDADLLDGTSLVWPISEDTELHRDPSRVYSGVYLPYDGGAVFREDSGTVSEFVLTGRDMSAPSLNVKSKAKAIARALRYLADLDSQDERITTTVRLPKGKASMIRAGMRVRFKASHLPGYSTYVWMRVLNCTPKPVSSGAFYDIALELQGPGDSVGALDTVTIDACNTVVENSERNVIADSASLSFVAGSVWRYTITNTAHSGPAVVSFLSLGISTGPTDLAIRAWGAGYPSGAGVANGISGTGPGYEAPDQGFPPPTIALPTQTGTFIAPATETALFRFNIGTGYYGAGGSIADECYRAVLERLS